MAHQVDRWRRYRLTVQIAAVGLICGAWSWVTSLTYASSPGTGWFLVAGGVALWGLVFAVVGAALGLLAGRTFCGWLCPLGTVQDLQHLALKPFRHLYVVSSRLPLAVRSVRWWVLGLVLGATLCGFWALSLLNPLGLVGRAVEGVLALLNANGFSTLGLCVTFGGLTFILTLGLFGHRIWCRVLCPLGSLFALLSRWSWVRWRQQSNACESCGACASACAHGALELGDNGIPAPQHADCLNCGACQQACEPGGISFVPTPRHDNTTSKANVLSRRVFVLGLACGVSALPLWRLVHYVAQSMGIRRPPGVREFLGEAAFLERCIGCGACVRACPRGVLRADGVSEVRAGAFPPSISNEAGPCPAACHACALVCPTEAIPLRLSQRPVHSAKASLDQQACDAYAGADPCHLCINACPLDPPAIRLEQIRDHLGEPHGVPILVAERCVGCGACVSACREGATGALHLIQFDEAGPTNGWG